MLLCQVLIGFHVFNSVTFFLRNNDHPLMLYHACMNPHSLYETSVWIKPLVWDNALLLTYHFILISGNFYLFFFLWTQTKNNKALTVIDRKKERKRNFVNAKTGIICAFWLPVTYVLYSILYGLKVNVFIELRFSQFETNQFYIDCGTKALILSIYNDLHGCIISPVAAVFGNPIIQRKIQKTIDEFFLIFR